jgi:hypothetical protein
VDELQFRQLVDTELAPMLQASVLEGTTTSTSQEALVAYASPVRILVKPTRTNPYRLTLSRSQPFTADDHALASTFVTLLSRILDLDSAEHEEELIRGIPRRVVAAQVNGGPHLESILQQLEGWSSRTYEGQRIATAIGLEPEALPTNEQGELLAKLWDEAFGPVIGNGFDTILVVGRSSGRLHRFEQLESAAPDRAPYRFGAIADWATGDRLAVVLNRHGELLLFRNRALTFARRNGRWLHFSHDANFKRLVPPKDLQLRQAIYTSCLDVSFARTGGCLGVVGFGRMTKLADLVSADDRLPYLPTYKARVINMAVAGRTFANLDRRLRMELLAMDGALVMNHYGYIVAVGAILKVPGGSASGGRAAAAKALGRRGIGIKISADGPITAYRGEPELLRM